MAVTQYIGSRYVPLFADPIDWDITKQYEPLTIVYYQGNSFTSKQAVPSNIDITNTDYWVITGNYNAQVEQYRREVQTFDGRITANAQAIADEVTARMAADETIRGIIDDLQGDLSDEVTARESADTQIRTDFAAADTQIRTDFAAADTQIRTDFTAADTALGTRIDNSNSRISTLENITQDKMLIIGDSFGMQMAGTNNPTFWWEYVAKQLNLTPINYSGSGAGFTFIGGNPESSGNGKYKPGISGTFNDFITQASNDTSFSNNDVRYVFIYGGLNDTRGSVEVNSYQSAVRTAIQNAKNKFPKSQIIVIGANTWNDLNSSTNGVYIGVIASHIGYVAMSEGVTFINSVYDTFGYGGGIYGNDGHPNQSGQKFIASMILNSVFGTGSRPNHSFDIACASGGSGTITLQFQNEMIFVHAEDVRTSTDNAGADFPLPNGLKILHNQFICAPAVGGKDRIGWLWNDVTKLRLNNMADVNGFIDVSMTQFIR